jgi:hypothetical protein
VDQRDADRRTGKRIIGIGIPIPTVLVKRGFVDAVSRSARWSHRVQCQAIFGFLEDSLNAKHPSNSSMGLSASSGFRSAADLGLALIRAAASLNLGLVNLLPIPILDGVMLLFC